MVTGNINIIVLKAGAGKVFTPGEEYASPGGTIYLGSNDTADNWREIDESEVPTEEEN